MGGGQKAPQAYTPANSAGADSAYYGTLNNLTQQNQATAATANAGYNAAYSGIVNNPYDQSMVDGTVATANSANAAAGYDYNNANLMGLQALAGYGDANTARATAAPMTADADALRAYAPLLTEYGFDPNMSSYNFGLKQTQDQQNVINAQSGTAGSPFGAGATGDAMATYTRNYQAAQASKAMQALQALSQLYTGASDLDTNAIAALAKAGGIAGNAANIATQGSNLANEGVQMQGAAATLPYGAVNQIYQDRQSALDEMVNGNAAASAPITNDVQGFGNYLKIGQDATTVNQNAAKINNQNSVLGQLGQLAGIAVQVGAHFIPGYG